MCRDHRNRAANDSSAADPRRIYRLQTSESAASEVLIGDPRRGSSARVRIHAREGDAVDLRVDDGGARYEIPAAPAVPRVIFLIRRERHPADVAKCDADRKIRRAISEERDASRHVDGFDRDGRRNPGPAVHVAAVPAAVVKRRPAPPIVIDPGPAVTVFPDPAAVPVRRPARGHVGDPNVAVIGNDDPLSVAGEIVERDRRVDVRIAQRGFRLNVERRVPSVERVVSDRSDVSNDRIARCGERASRTQANRSPGHQHVGLSRPDGDLRLATTGYADAITSAAIGTHGDRRRIDLRSPIGSADETKPDRTLRELRFAVTAIEIDESQLGVRANADRRTAVHLYDGSAAIPS